MQSKSKQYANKLEEAKLQGIKVEGLVQVVDKEEAPEQVTVEVSTEIPEKAKVEKDDKQSFEDFKTLYKGVIDIKCKQDYGTADDSKLWEDTAKELFLKSKTYLPVGDEYKPKEDLDSKVEKVEESKKVESADDRYQVREFDGPGAKYGVYDTKQKRFVQKGAKYVMNAACNDLNKKDKKTESDEKDLSKDVFGAEADERTYKKLLWLDAHIENYGKDYRFEVAPNPIEQLRDRRCDNTRVGRFPHAARSTDFFCNSPNTNLRNSPKYDY